MCRFLFGLAVMSTFVFSGAAFAGPRSLNDLPSKWHGMAGDLFHRTDASLVIRTSYEVSRDEQDGGFTALYDVDAQLVLPNRTIAVNQIQMRAFGRDGEVMEITLMTGDELEPNLFATVKYDSKTRSFTLMEFMKDGARRFILSATK